MSDETQEDNEKDEPIEKESPRGKRKIGKIVSEPVTKKKRSWLDKMAESFFGDDADSVGSYILFDVLVPAVKNTVIEMVTSGIEMLLLGGGSRGEPGLTRRRGRDDKRGFTSYSSYYSGRDRAEKDRLERRETGSHSKYKFDDIIIKSRQEAQEILQALIDQIDEYDSVTVSEFLDAVDVESYYTDHKYGWTNLSRATVAHARGGGYVLILPKPYELD